MSGLGELGEFQAFAAKEGGLDLRDEQLSFRRQMGGDRVESSGPVALEQGFDGAFAGVVCGESQTPILIDVATSRVSMLHCNGKVV